MLFEGGLAANIEIFLILEDHAARQGVGTFVVEHLEIVIKCGTVSSDGNGDIIGVLPGAYTTDNVSDSIILISQVGGNQGRHSTGTDGRNIDIPFYGIGQLLALIIGRTIIRAFPCSYQVGGVDIRRRGLVILNGVSLFVAGDHHRAAEKDGGEHRKNFFHGKNFF